MWKGKLGYGSAVCAVIALALGAPSTACFVDIDQGLLDAGPCPTCALEVEFEDESGMSTTTAVAHLDFNIVNNATVAQDMTAITLKFFYTSQGVLTSPTVDCYEVSAGTCPSPVTPSSSLLSASFAPFSPMTATADSAMVLGFPMVNIPAGGNLLVRVGLHNVSSSGNFDLTKDYSFTAADASTFAVAPNIPLYSNGVLFWGNEP